MTTTSVDSPAIPKVDQHINTAPIYTNQLRNLGAIASVTLFASMLLFLFLMPFAYGFITAFKDKDQIVTSANGGPIYPADPVTFEYEGEELLIYNVSLPDGSTQALALLDGRRRDATFIDPENPTAEPIEWEGRYRQLSQQWEFSPRFGNFAEAWEGVEFPLLLRNTIVIAVSGLIGTIISSVVVAYAFARFPLPMKNVMFIVLIGTIILPTQVRLVPMYAFFDTIGWTGTWLPLIVPHFFANAYNVFLLRQYFLTLPRDLDEAAMIDGANPLQILVYVIIPQSYPVLVAVGLFHFVFAWNDYFEPLIYLLGKPELQPISVGIQRFNFIYDQQPHLIQATSLMALVLPVAIFFFAQRFFMRGVVITGVEK